MSDTAVVTPPAAEKAPSSFMEVFSAPEASHEWSQAIAATEARKRKEPFTPSANPAIDPDIAEEEAAVKELEKPVVTPKAEVKPEPKPEADPTFKTAKAGEHFKRLKEESNRKIAELTKELEAAKKGGADKSELDSIRAERDAERAARLEFEDKLKLLAVKEHPGFKKHFDAKLDSAITTAKRVVGAERAAQIEQLLRMPDSEYRNEKLNEIADGLGGVKAAQLGAVLLDFEKINAEREGEIAKYQERYQEMTAAQKRQFEEQQRQSQSIFQERLKSLTDKEKGLDFWRTKEGDDAWNADVTERLALAEAVYRGDLEPQERANIAFWAAAAPSLMKSNKSLAQQLAEANKQIESMKANKPRIGESGGNEPQTAEAPEKFDSFTSPAAQSLIASRMGR